MKKNLFTKLFFVVVIASTLCLVACQNDPGNTPSLDTTELWPAAITHDVKISKLEDQDPYPDSTLYGYINRQGKMVIRPQFITAGSFSCGYAPVQMKYASNPQIPTTAYLDKSGSIHTIGGYDYYPGEEGICAIPSPFYYNIAVIYHMSLPSVGNYYSSCMVDRNINVVSDWIGNGKLHNMTADGLAAYVDDNIFEVSHYNRSGKKVLQTKAYPDDPQFKDGYIVLRLYDQNYGLFSNKYSIIDKSGNVMYEDSLPLSNLGHQRFLRQHPDALSSEDLYDIIDAQGHLLGSPEFSAPELLEEEQYLVKRTAYEQLHEYASKREYYYINQDGKQTIQRSFCSAQPFQEGYALVYDWNLETGEAYPYEIINKKGETVLTLEPNENFVSYHNGLLLTSIYEYMSSGRYEGIYHYTYKDLSGNVVYSWDEKWLRNSNNAPAQVKSFATDSIDVNVPFRVENGNYIFPDGLYLLGPHTATK